MNLESLSTRLEQCYTGVVNDVMRDMGLTHFLLPSDLFPLITGQTLAGPVFTISGRPTQGAGAHETLLSWTGLFAN